MRSGRTNARATSSTTTRAMTIAASTNTVSTIAALRRSAAWACTALVTEAVTFLMTWSAMSSVAWTDRSRSALSTSTLAGSDMIAIRATICCCSVLASGDPAPSTSLMPNSVDGSVPARVAIEVRSCGSGSSAPRVMRIFCIVICPRAPTARLKPWAWARMCSSSTRTEALMTSSAVNRIGAYRVTRSRRPRPLSDALLTSIWPASSSVLTPDRTSSVTSVSASRPCSSPLRAS